VSEYEATLLDQIYEAAVVPDAWRTIITSLSDRFDAKGGLLFTSSPDQVRWLGAGESESIMVDFIAQGWPARNDRVGKLLQMQRPGFVTDTDVDTAEELSQHPMYKEFLIPRGVYAAAATAIQGAAVDMLIFSVEGFPDHDAARRAIPFLDGLRSHLARASMLASQFNLERARAAITALQMIGVPAAFISATSRIRAVNRLFEPMIGAGILDTVGGIRLADSHADKRLRAVLDGSRSGLIQGLSIPLLLPQEGGIAVLHVLPVTGQARDVFLDGGVILLITGIGPTNPPSAGILQALFDLTPAEARLARSLANGASPDDIAGQLDVRVSTIRSQLKSLFAKLGINRQAQLVALLAKMALPGL
jgi:DNA-binding CsgD family transcriptional regulator